jgi:hypothetical protein
MNDSVRVDYADREMAPNGGLTPEDFSSYLEELCNRRVEEGYKLIAVTPASGPEGRTIGAWLFFAWNEEPESPAREFEVSAALEEPQPGGGIQTFPPPPEGI